MSKAANTRLTILQKAFELIYTKGYQATSIDDIIATTKVTKGAFFYHFKNKDEMGLAIINEVVKPTVFDSFITPMQESTDPVKDIYLMTKALLFDTPFLKPEYGCPAGNLAQEMTPWNTDFADALAAVIGQWQQTLEDAIKSARAGRLIRRDVNPKQVALFIMSGYWGIRSLGKVYNSTDCYNPYLKELKRYLNGLK